MAKNDEIEAILETGKSDSYTNLWFDERELRRRLRKLVRKENTVVEALENLIIFTEMFLAKPELDQEVARRHLIGRIREAREALPKHVAPTDCDSKSKT